jgi:hypothetical protein
MCRCQRFPVYASKLPQPDSPSSFTLAEQLSHLCLHCARFFTSRAYAKGRLHDLWRRHLEDEWAAYYQRFYSPSEEDSFIRQESLDHRAWREQYTLNRIWPLLDARGGLPCETEKDEEAEESEDDYWESESEDEEKVGEDEAEEETGSEVAAAML